MTTRFSPPPSARAIAWWLAVCAAMIFVMVVLGGATRLTESGLSMVEWKPLTFLPPVSDAQWQDEFTAYQASPEFQKKNTWMTVDDFKKIYWFEYTHRLWGRLIGLAFAVPFAWFVWRGAIGRPMALKLGGILALGGLQGALGWFMVASGLQDRPDVSQYRLAAHLVMAFILYGMIVWVILGLVRKQTAPLASVDRLTRRIALFIPVGVLAVVAAGAFVAGLNAGLIYNTFPLMGDRLLPEGLYEMQPWYLSAFEDALTVQFNHRFLAVALVGLTAAVWLRGRTAVRGRARLALNGLMAMTFVQAALGIATLVLVVPLPLALAHQTGALVLLTLAVWFAHCLNDTRGVAVSRAPSLHVSPAE